MFKEIKAEGAMGVARVNDEDRRRVKQAAEYLCALLKELDSKARKPDRKGRMKCGETAVAALARECAEGILDAANCSGIDGECPLCQS